MMIDKLHSRIRLSIKTITLRTNIFQFFKSIALQIVIRRVIIYMPAKDILKSAIDRMILMLDLPRNFPDSLAQ